MKDRLLELDALRGIAAMAVVLFHFTINRNAIDLGWQFNYGVTGVDVFFMISGFVIFLTINTKTERGKDFVISRFSRLYPTYWTCVLLTAFFILVYEPTSFKTSNVLANFTMFPTYFCVEDLDGSYWTLLVELVFYVWIFLIYLSGGLKNIITIGLICMSAIVAFHFFGYYYPQLYKLASHKIQLINHFPLFLSGIVFFKIKFESFKPGYLIIVLACILSSVYLHDKGGKTMYFIGKFEHTMVILFYHFIFTLFVAGKLAFLNLKPLLFLGKISYSLYLIHQYVGLHLIETFKNLGLNIYAAILLCISICICMAWVITKYIEIPAVKLIRSQYAKATNKAPVRTPPKEEPALQMSKTGYHFQ
ncbi:hypothetical protein DSL64_10165 [Dyadobacter luteus]|uniref:Acyltransferase 3 domain-containing protein n=1 Tax=Dyadobacter luteus TaxID=2259619 RepID=A0A3D8YD46_9BACT|nr:acyltransferase [Dyadobacter luteus]REA62018.1 hypothetical protein DSL64_10165 [Dyadobacter luteus]